MMIPVDNNRKPSKMSNLLFIRRSLALRHAAAAAIRQARAMPVGSERNDARRLARGLKEWARTEAWLEGQSSLASQGFGQGSRQRQSTSCRVVAFGA
jgi:hypothetical protein